MSPLATHSAAYVCRTSRHLIAPPRHKLLAPSRRASAVWVSQVRIMQGSAMEQRVLLRQPVIRQLYTVELPELIAQVGPQLGPRLMLNLTAALVGRQPQCRVVCRSSHA